MSHRIDALAHGNRLRHLPPGQKAAFAATLLLLWQTRAGPAAQMLAVTGAAALVWLLVLKRQVTPMV